MRIESYALLGDGSSVALVGTNGSIDWLCAPRFDSPACFAALLGGAENGFWRIAPVEPEVRVERSYRDRSLVLETHFTCAGGSVRLTDCMVVGGSNCRLVRIAEGLTGSVALRMEYVVRFDYGSIVPWLRRVAQGLLAVGGPDALLLSTGVELESRELSTVAEFTLGPGERAVFDLLYFPSEADAPTPGDALEAVAATEAASHARSAGFAYDGPYRDVVLRSLVTLAALTFTSTGGIVAAATTSLPEQLGGVRNWDYRYCWLRDATFTLYALLTAGFVDAAARWRSWLLRAVAGAPDDLQIVYGIRGTRRLPEIELPWLAGYENSKPVRIGNDAHGQFQLDVYGEVVDLLYAAHRFGIESSDDEWRLAQALVGLVERRWREPDRGLWEMRGPPQHFTHSKVMAWVALDRAVKGVEQHGLEGPLERWRAARDAIHADVCARGFDAERGTFTQYYGSRALDASTLLIPMVGFLPPEDERVRGTIAAIERHLVSDGLVFRYTQAEGESPDPLPPGEGAFLACSFWLVDCYTLLGRRAEAESLFERLIALRNDVGLLAEEYDPREGRLVGNFPQAFSHVGLINSAFNLAHHTRPAHDRAGGQRPAAVTGLPEA
jgi:GH15 family glucan-1,4-alpha-glucosidase